MLLRLVLLVFSVIELLFPRTVVDFGMKLSTEAESDFEVRPWVYSIARVEGLVLVLAALGVLQRGSAPDAPSA